MDDYEIKERIEKTEYLVEADNEHVMYLWSKHATQAQECGAGTERVRPRFDWKNGPGILAKVGELDGRSVAIEICWDIINGALVAFHHATSELVDHRMIEEYLDKKFKGIKRTDAAHFNDVINVIGKRDSEDVVIEESKRAFGRQALEVYERTGVLTRRVVSDYTIEKARRSANPSRSDPEIDEIMEQLGYVMTELQKAIDEFAAAVWDKWLKTRARDNRGLEANVDNINMLVWRCAGRVMISLRRQDWPDENDHVTLIGSDGKNDECRLSLQGINFNGEMAIDLVRKAANLGDLQVNTNPNENIGVG